MRALLVPVKSFKAAKHRLASVLSDRERAELARLLGEVVLGARGPLATYVACDDDEVADWAVAQGAFVLWTAGLGLSGAVDAGVRYLSTIGVSLAVVAHADLPGVASFADFGTEGVVTLAPDLRHDGTNVAAVPTDCGFRFAYGPGSFTRHCEEAARRGLKVAVVEDERFSSDVDLPEDLELVPALLADARLRAKVAP